MDSVLTKTQRKLHVEKSPANCAESQGRILDKGVISNHTSDKFIYFDVRNGIFCKLYRTTNWMYSRSLLFFCLLQIQYPMLPTEQDTKILLTTFELETTRDIVTSHSTDDFHEINAIIWTHLSWSLWISWHSLTNLKLSEIWNSG